MVLSTALRTALTNAPKGPWLLEIVVAGTTYRYAANIAGYTGGGQHYSGKILSISGLDARLSDWRGGLASPGRVTVQIEDIDRELMYLSEGVHGLEIPGSAATLYRVHPDVAKGTPTTGWFAIPLEIADAPEWPEPFKAQLSLARRDSKFVGLCPSTAYTLTADAFPDLASSDVGKIGPLLFGQFDSTATTGQGMLPLIRVASGVYVLCSGIALGVDNVWAAGIKQVGNWTIGTTYKAGGVFTTVTFSSAIPAAGVAVTCDARGYASGGVLIEDPIAALQYLIQTWIDPTASIDSTSFASTFYSRSGVKLAKYITSRQSGYDLINELLRSNEMALCWYLDGSIHVAPLDPCHTDIYQTDPVLDWSQHSFAPVPFRNDNEIATDLELKYLYDPAAGSYAGVLGIMELDALRRREAKLELPWGAAQ